MLAICETVSCRYVANRIGRRLEPLVACTRKTNTKIHAVAGHDGNHGTERNIIYQRVVMALPDIGKCLVNPAPPTLMCVMWGQGAGAL